MISRMTAVLLSLTMIVSPLMTPTAAAQGVTLPPPSNPYSATLPIQGAVYSSATNECVNISGSMLIAGQLVSTKSGRVLRLVTTLSDNTTAVGATTGTIYTVTGSGASVIRPVPAGQVSTTMRLPYSMYPSGQAVPDLVEYGLVLIIGVLVEAFGVGQAPMIQDPSGQCS